MKTIYLDSGFKCHVVDNGTMQAVETDIFDGFCDAYIEGYRYIPEGQRWTRYDGVVFHGVMVAPWKDYNALDAVQRKYEKQLLAEYAEALRTVGVEV